VVSGEGEDSIVQLLSAISGEMEFSEVQNLSWRDASGQSIANAQVSTTDISKMPPPDFDAYFKQVAEYPVAESVEPTLVLETSRGCWWGAKHHCTFCGLNGSTMAYRKKSPETIIREITGLVDRHQALDIIMADNIIAMESFSDLLPVLKEMDLDVRLQFEIKANLTAEQVTLLRDSKVIHVQPGIESLSSHVLKLMKKGVTGAQNVYSLRELEANNITVSWNLLAGFPGERESDYEQMIRSFEDLCHLAPPIGVMRIMIQRFSPFFDKPWLGFEEKYPAKSYEVIYDRPQHVLNEMVYMFEANSAGISHDLIDRMEASVEQWKKRYWSGPALNHSVQGERILISDSRPNRPSEPYWLAVGLESAVFLELDKPSRLTGLMRRLKDQNLEIERIDLEGVLTHLISLGLVFAEDGWFLRLSIGEQPHRIRQVHCVTKVAQSEELNLMPLHA
ncbi:MAG: RiPP maturation radical SAM C-methyltransferase, partial [Betaproteobacteria bacterium]